MSSGALMNQDAMNCWIRLLNWLILALTPIGQYLTSELHLTLNKLTPHASTSPGQPTNQGTEANQSEAV